MVFCNEYHKRTGISLGQCIGLLSINSGIGGERHLMGFVFVNSKGKHFSQRRLDTVWLQAARSCGIEINLYQATRHSFATQKIAVGFSRDKVGQMMGHRNPYHDAKI